MRILVSLILVLCATTSGIFLYSKKVTSHSIDQQPQASGNPGDLKDPRETHLANIKQLTFEGENAEAYFSQDGKKLIFRVMGLAAVGTVLVLTNLPPVPLWFAMLAATVFMVTTSGRMVPAQALITASAAPSVRGGFLSLNGAVQAAAMGLASLLGGALIGQTEDGRLPGYPIVGMIAAVSALLSLVLAGLLRTADAGPTRVPVREEAVVAEAV